MKNSIQLAICLSITVIMVLLHATIGYTNPCNVERFRSSVLAEQLESVLSITFHPKHNNILAVGRSDGTIRLWNTSTPEVLQTLGGRSGAVEGHTDVIFTLAFSPDGNKLASGSADGTVRVWNTADVKKPASIKELWKFSEHNGLVLTLAFLTENGNVLASGSINGSIRFWNLITGAWQDVISGDGLPAVLSLAASRENNLLATGRSDNKIRVWNLTNGGVMHTFDGHADDVTSLVFNSDGDMLVSGSADGTVRLWNINTDTSPHELKLSVDWINSVALHGTTIASASHDSTIFLWDLNTKAPLGELTEHKGSVESIAFSADGKTIASGGYDGKVLLWELTPPQIEGDVNGDGFVNLLDLDLVNARLGMTGNDTADINGDAVVNITDLVMVSNIIVATTAERSACVHERTDVNKDTIIDMEDLKAVDASFGTIGLSDADVNLDGIVNVIDLVLVANAMGPAAAAPSLRKRVTMLLTVEQVQRWLTEARLSGETTLAYQHGMVVLEQLLVTLTPQATVLLPNYPNPLNPETWIPYRLAESADVTLTIYAANGRLVRTLEVGYHAAGTYQSRARAAYWDGKNELGERVATGLYFYTLTAGNFSATRKMSIRK